MVGVKKKIKKSDPGSTSGEVQKVEFHSREERLAAGKLLRQKIPRFSHIIKYDVLSVRVTIFYLSGTKVQ